jgi:hypothetical protein
METMKRGYCVHGDGGLVKIKSTERDGFLTQTSINNPFVGVKIRLGDKSPKNEKLGGLKE